MDSVLDPLYRSDNNAIYTFWNFMRGITAPIFFFASGLISSFLIFSKVKKGKHVYIKKTFIRGIVLIGVGYLLNIIMGSHELFNNNIEQIFRVGVLHTIGVALIVISLLSFLLIKFKKTIPYVFALSEIFVFYLGNLINLSEYIDFWLIDLPIIKQYFYKNTGTLFTIFPWIGYSLFGAVLGYILSIKKQLANNYWLMLALIAIGLLLHFFHHHILSSISILFPINIKQIIMMEAWRYMRLGDALIVTGIIGSVPIIFNKQFNYLNKIGANTLLIFITHEIILYGLILGTDIGNTMRKSLNPFESILSAITVITLCLISLEIWPLLIKKIAEKIK
ncbi:MAG: hypothetical protein Kapaf2KO_09980 [Candidatus Kapaibacteriales bacterium]